MGMSVIGFSIIPSVPTISTIKKVWEINFCGSASLADFPQWTNTLGGTAATTAYDSVGGTMGCFQFATGANLNSENTLTTDKGFKLKARTGITRFVFEAEISPNGVPTAYTAEFGIRKDADQYCFFQWRGGDIWGMADDGGTDTYAADSGETVTRYVSVNMRIEIDLSTGTPYFFINDELVLTGTASSTDDDDGYKPYFHIKNDLAATDTNFRFLGARLYYY